MYAESRGFESHLTQPFPIGGNCLPSCIHGETQMSQFLKLKSVEGGSVLVAVSEVSTFSAGAEGTVIVLKNSDELVVKEGLQAINSRLEQVGSIVA